MKNTLSFIFLLIGLNLSAQCSNQNHSVNASDAWLSCEKSQAPNPERGVCHWVMYDLGYSYNLKETTFWNYNVTGQKNRGFRGVVIDYSLDGITWIKGAEFILPKAPALNTYSGFAGPHLGGNAARYILISAKKTYGNGECGGLSEFRVNVSEYSMPVRLMTENLSVRENDNEPILNENIEINIYPNPSSNIINVDFDGSEIKEIIIQNSAGFELKRMKTESYFERIDISTFPNGMYYLNLISAENKVITKRFVKVY